MIERTESMAVHPEGDVEDGFGRVADVFAKIRSADPRGGAGFCMYVEGRKVVDLVDGTVGDSTVRYGSDTIQLAFSCTKGISALVVNMLAAENALKLEAPVAQYWPEFAEHGKGETTVNDVLSHRAGLPCFDGDLDLNQVCDGETIATGLAAQHPVWLPGSEHGYHAVTYGFLLSEIVRRATGSTIGQLVRSRLALGEAKDLWIGTPESELSRVAAAIPPDFPRDEETRNELRRFAPDSEPGRALTLNGVLAIGGPHFAYNDSRVLGAEIPAANAVGSARSIAAVYSAAVRETGNRRILEEDAVAKALTPLSDGPDRILGRPTRFGPGFMLSSPDVQMLSETSFGHPGAGGSLALADSELGVGLAFLTTRMGPHIVGDPRANALVAAARSVLGH